MQAGSASDTLFERIVDDLLMSLQAHRVTLRQDLPGDYAFPVTHEACAPGVASLRDFTALGQVQGPTFVKMLRDKEAVVVADSTVAIHGGDEDYSEHRAYFEELMDLYGGMAAFVAAPVVVDEEVVGVISVHQLGDPREWTDTEVERVCAAAHEVAGQLADESTSPR